MMMMMMHKRSANFITALNPPRNDSIT